MCTKKDSNVYKKSIIRTVNTFSKLSVHYFLVHIGAQMCTTWQQWRNFHKCKCAIAGQKLFFAQIAHLNSILSYSIIGIFGYVEF